MTKLNHLLLFRWFYW